MQTCLRTSTAITVSISSAPSASNTKALAAILPSEIHLLQYQGFVTWQAENQLVEFYKSRSLRGGWVPTCPASAVSWLGPFLLSAIWRNRGSEGGSWAEAGLTVAKRCYIKPNWRYYQVLPSLGRQFKLLWRQVWLKGWGSVLCQYIICMISLTGLYWPISVLFCVLSTLNSHDSNITRELQQILEAEGFSQALTISFRLLKIFVSTLFGHWKQNGNRLQVCVCV